MNEKTSVEDLREKRKKGLHKCPCYICVYTHRYILPRNQRRYQSAPDKTHNSKSLPLPIL